MGREPNFACGWQKEKSFQLLTRYVFCAWQESKETCNSMSPKPLAPLGLRISTALKQAPPSKLQTPSHADTMKQLNVRNIQAGCIGFTASGFRFRAGGSLNPKISAPEISRKQKKGKLHRGCWIADRDKSTKMYDAPEKQGNPESESPKAPNPIILKN